MYLFACAESKERQRGGVG